MKNLMQQKLQDVAEKCSKNEIVEYLKLKNLKGGKNCPPPFEIDKKK